MLLVTFSCNLKAYQVLKICYLVNFIFKCIVAFALFSYAYSFIIQMLKFCLHLLCLMDFNFAAALILLDGL